MEIFCETFEFKMILEQKLKTLSDSARFGLKLLAVLGLAAMGQFSLAQTGPGFSLCAGVGFYAVSVFFLFRFFSAETSTLVPSLETVDFKIEGFLFLIVLAFGIFLRAYGANRLPEGIFVDRAEVACGALRILYDHWRPFLDALNLHVPELWIYYMAAGWFKLFGSAPEVYSYFDVFLSTAGIVLMYTVFRQLAGPFPSLLAFFLLAVMRWNFFFAHQDYFQSQTVFFMALTLAPLLYALRAHKPVLSATAGLALGAGLYSYQSFKAFPLLAAALLLFEFFRERKRFKKNKEVWIVFWIVFALAATPYLGWVLQNGALGRRDAEVSILGDIQARQSLLPFWENIRDMIFILNHSDVDWNSRSYFQHHQILDNITGVLLVLGFFYALRRVKERLYFIVIAGLMVMSLPGVFSDRGTTSMGRLLGMTPFVACICAFFLMDLWNRWKATQPTVLSKQAVLGLTLCLLAAIGFENYRTYFLIQARIPEYNDDCSWSESKAGRFIAAQPIGTECFLPSRFYRNPTVQYLTYPNGDRIHPLDLTHLPQSRSYPHGTSFCFVLDEYKNGTLEFLKTIYPGGNAEMISGPLGNIPLYLYRVPSSVLKKFETGPFLKRGLEGFYRHIPDEKEAPFLRTWDPILNFNFRDLPGTGTPLFIHWTGQFKATQKGVYRMGAQILNTSQGRIRIDQKDQRGFSNPPYWEGELKPGWHRLDFDYQNPGLAVEQVNLLWKPPGQAQFEIVPNGVLGKIKE